MIFNENFWFSMIHRGSIHFKVNESIRKTVKKARELLILFFIESHFKF
jgi:hypothetical protein